MVHKKYSNIENYVIEIYMLSKSFTLFNLILHLFNEDCQQPIATSGFPPLFSVIWLLSNHFTMTVSDKCYF